MNLRRLEIFVAVCECSSMTEAANKLHLAQPAVSLAISELEARYGIKLFDRMSRKIFITAAGRQLLERAMYIISLYKDMELQMHNWEATSSLRVGSSLTIGARLLPTYLRQFALKYPDIKVKVHINVSDVLKDKVLANEVDFALVEGLVSSDYISWENYQQDELVPICAAEHSFANHHAVPLAELVKQPLLLREQGSGTREVFDYALATRDALVEPLWESASTAAIIEGVAAGFGLSVLPLRLVQDAVSAGRVSTFGLDGLEFMRYFKIIYHRSKYLSEAALAFMALVRSIE